MIWPQQLPSQPVVADLNQGKSVAPIQPPNVIDAEEPAQPAIGRPPAQHSVGAWMQSVVATCSPDQTLGELSEMLSLHQISGAPVVDGAGKLLGVVSQSDVAAYLGGLYTEEIRAAAGFYQGLMGRISSADPAVRGLLETQTVENLYTPHVHAVSPEATLDEVVDLMLQEHVHRLPVVQDGKLVGLVSTLDVMRVMRDRRALQQQAEYRPRRESQPD